MATQPIMTQGCSDWTAACEVQQRFLQPFGPAFNPIDFKAVCRQARELGGDFYDMLPLPGDSVGIAIGDASGKGLPAALMISNVQSSLRTAALFIGNDGAAVVDLVNRQVHGSSLVDRYATLFYGIFDRVTRTLRYVNAGHNPPMLIRADGSVSWLEAGGAPVGMFPDWSYTEGSVNLRPGDMLVAYTDGVVEAQNADGVEWGVEGLQAAAQAAHPRSAERMLQSLLGALDEFSDGCQADDVTLAVLRVL